MTSAFHEVFACLAHCLGNSRKKTFTMMSFHTRTLSETCMQSFQRSFEPMYSFQQAPIQQLQAFYHFSKIGSAVGGVAPSQHDSNVSYILRERVRSTRCVGTRTADAQVYIQGAGISHCPLPCRSIDAAKVCQKYLAALSIVLPRSLPNGLLVTGIDTKRTRLPFVSFFASSIDVDSSRSNRLVRSVKPAAA